MFLIATGGDADPASGAASLAELMLDIELGVAAYDWQSPGQGRRPGDHHPPTISFELPPVTKTGAPVSYDYQPAVGVIAFVPPVGAVDADNWPGSWAVAARALAVELARLMAPAGYSHLEGFFPAESSAHTVLHVNQARAPTTAIVESYRYEKIYSSKRALPRSWQSMPYPARSIVCTPPPTSAKAKNGKTKKCEYIPSASSRFSAFTWVIIPISYVLKNDTYSVFLDKAAAHPCTHVDAFNLHAAGIVFDRSGLLGAPRALQCKFPEALVADLPELGDELAAAQAWIDDDWPAPPGLPGLIHSWERMTAGNTHKRRVPAFVIEGGRLRLTCESMVGHLEDWVDLDRTKIPLIEWDPDAVADEGWSHIGADGTPVYLCATCETPLYGVVYLVGGGIYVNRKDPPRKWWALCRYCCGAVAKEISVSATSGTRLRRAVIPGPATLCDALVLAGWDALVPLAEADYVVRQDKSPLIIEASRPDGQRFRLLSREFRHADDADAQRDKLSHIAIKYPKVWTPGVPLLRVSVVVIMEPDARVDRKSAKPKKPTKSWNRPSGAREYWERYRDLLISPEPKPDTDDDACVPDDYDDDACASEYRAARPGRPPPGCRAGGPEPGGPTCM